MDENIVNNTAPEETGSTETQVSNQENKTFTQEDVDRIVRNRLAQVERKYEGVNLEEYHSLRDAAEKAKRADMMKREKFEELLQQQKTESDSKVQTLQRELERVKVDGALLSAAAKHRAVNPDHVANLLKQYVRLGENGGVEVLDAEGNVRYDTVNASAMTVDQVVEEFISTNAYFRSAAPSGAGSSGDAKHSTSREVNLADLNMNNPEDRKRYRDIRKSMGLS